MCLFYSWKFTSLVKFGAKFIVLLLQLFTVWMYSRSEIYRNVNIRDLLDCELFEDGSDQKPYLLKWTEASNWIVIQPADHSWWKVAVIKWGQIDFIH